MKRLYFLLIGTLMSTNLIFGGGLVTNTNQSAAWARTLTRQAAYGIDAVYFNPAGLGLLDNGLHVSLSNQSIFQTRQVTNSYPLITGAPKTYEGTAKAPVFPSAYAVMKLGKLAISAGFNIIGGGGSAEFAEGLPVFERQVSSVPALLSGVDNAVEALTTNNPGFSNITGYSMDAYFNGSSVYYGIQAGLTYSINKMISVAVGARYVSVKNSYQGNLSNITLDAPVIYGGTQSATQYLTLVGDQINPFDANTGALLYGTAASLNDPELDATQTGSGITPIIGLNLHLTDMINVGLKYEHHTTIELTNDNTVDDVNMYPKGAKSRADLPGMVSGGVQVKPVKKLTGSLGFNYYMDRPAYYGKYETDADGNPVLDEDGISYVQINNETTIDNNAFDVSVSLEYMLKDNIGVSGGYSMGNNGVNDNYQSDLNHALKTSTVAGGVYIGIGNKIGLNAGVVYVIYQEGSVTKADGMTGINYTETYMKNTMIFAVGIDINL